MRLPFLRHPRIQIDLHRRPPFKLASLTSLLLIAFQRQLKLVFMQLLTNLQRHQGEHICSKVSSGFRHVQGLKTFYED